MEERLWFNLPSMVPTQSECKSYFVTGRDFAVFFLFYRLFWWFCVGSFLNVLYWLGDQVFMLGLVHCFSFCTVVLFVNSFYLSCNNQLVWYYLLVFASVLVDMVNNMFCFLNKGILVEWAVYHTLEQAFPILSCFLCLLVKAITSIYICRSLKHTHPFTLNTFSNILQLLFNSTFYYIRLWYAKMNFYN